MSEVAEAHMVLKALDCLNSAKKHMDCSHCYLNREVFCEEKAMQDAAELIRKMLTNN